MGVRLKNHINIQNPQADNCCGCSACAQSCPKQCISMVENIEGFLYPYVDEDNCIDCGICSNSCSWLKNGLKQRGFNPQVYAVKNKNDEVRLRSTSGGMFSALADYVFSKHGIVYGASFVPEHKRVQYIGVDSEKELYRIRGSKYVQCYVGDTFCKIKRYLREGRIVLFTGTPCHCSALMEFLKKAYDNLFVVDILCHSVPSPRVFCDFLKKNEKKLSEPIKDIAFRDKTRGWRESYHCVISGQSHSIEDQTFLTLFFKGLINRPSCYNCRYTSIIRPTDLTMGDYWNINTVDSTFEDELGVSCVVVNNTRGSVLFDRIKGRLDVLETPIAPAVQDCMRLKTGEPMGRSRFWEDYSKYGYDYCEHKYGVTTRLQILRYKLGTSLSRFYLFRYLKRKIVKLVNVRK